MFLRMIRNIQAEHLKFKTWVKTFGFSMEMMRFFKLINEGNFNTISGSYINPIIMELFSTDKKALEIPKISDKELHMA